MEESLSEQAVLLDLTLQPQEQSNWCWAAVTVSVERHYAPEVDLTQCQLACTQLSEVSCCTSGSSSACNQPWYLDLALRQVERLARYSDGMPDTGALLAELDAGRPVGLLIGWTGGGGHFVLVVGYEQDADGLYLDIADPWFGDASVLASAFPQSYQSGGSWLGTYWIQD